MGKKVTKWRELKKVYKSFKGDLKFFWGQQALKHFSKGPLTIITVIEYTLTTICTIFKVCVLYSIVCFFQEGFFR